jgi:hypothetical protein
MKYLKLYENFGKKLYSDIEGIDFSEKIELEQRYIDLIQKHLNEGFYVEKMDTVGWCRISYKGLPGRHNDFYCDIFQMEDYNFNLEILNTLDENYGKTIFNSYYYRCDDIDGLFQFLKDENIITENPFEENK